MKEEASKNKIKDFSIVQHNISQIKNSHNYPSKTGYIPVKSLDLYPKQA